MKKIFIYTLIVSLLFLNTATPLIAQEAPTAPTPPPAPEAPTPPAPPAPPSPPPSAPSAPTPPPAPSPVVASSPVAQVSPTPTPKPSVVPVVTPSPENITPTQDQTNQTPDSNTDSNQNSLTPQYGETTGGIDSSHGNGDPYINTGNATTGALVTNDVNSNLAGVSNSSGDINVGNLGNGAGSTNASDVNTSNNSSTIQINDADLHNNINLGAISGKNDTSHNTGVDNTIITGDANTTATVINGVNTNLDGVKVVEFNVDDTHTGDIVLDFPQTSGCTVTVCGTNGTISATNTGNGADSTNNAGVTSTNTDITFQNNSADVVNDLVLIADSGHNDASYNTGGDSSVTTGDANVVATINNFVNNNIAAAGEVLVAVVNIFGDLVGNILVPDYLASSGGGTTAQNSGNGTGSANIANVDNTNSSATTQVNNANIANNLVVDANTGGNSAENNTGGFANGDNVITTGDATLDVNAINIANSNVSGDDIWWLVFVNDASGNWVGKIVGAPDGASMAGSYGTEFNVTPDGTILAQNTGNGAGSTNTANVTNTNTTSTTQVNDANVVNNLTLVANTGKNDASYNTGGNSTVATGDANIMANILNFVNNNISGGKVMVSVINVFGSWMGSFVPAGEEAPPVPGIGGTNASLKNNQQNNGGSANSNSSSGTDSSNQTTSATANGQSGNGILGLVHKVISQNSNVLGSSDEVENVKAGTIMEDDSIVVPGIAKTAAAKTILPSWFWKVFTAGVLLVLIKRIHTLPSLKKKLTAKRVR